MKKEGDKSMSKKEKRNDFEKVIKDNNNFDRFEKEILRKLAELFEKPHNIMDVLTLYYECAKKDYEESNCLRRATLMVFNIYIAEFCYQDKLMVKQLLNWMEKDIDLFIDSHVIEIEASPESIKKIEKLKQKARDFELHKENDKDENNPTYYS